MPYFQPGVSNRQQRSRQDDYFERVAQQQQADREYAFANRAQRQAGEAAGAEFYSRERNADADREQARYMLERQQAEAAQQAQIQRDHEYQTATDPRLRGQRMQDMNAKADVDANLMQTQGNIQSRAMDQQGGIQERRDERQQGFDMTKMLAAAGIDSSRMSQQQMYALQIHAADAASARTLADLQAKAQQGNIVAQGLVNRTLQRDQSGQAMQRDAAQSGQNMQRDAAQAGYAQSLAGQQNEGQRRNIYAAGDVNRGLQADQAGFGRDADMQRFNQNLAAGREKFSQERQGMMDKAGIEGSMFGPNNIDKFEERRSQLLEKGWEYEQGDSEELADLAMQERKIVRSLRDNTVKPDVGMQMLTSVRTQKALIQPTKPPEGGEAMDRELKRSTKGDEAGNTWFRSPRGGLDVLPAPHGGPKFDPNKPPQIHKTESGIPYVLDGSGRPQPLPTGVAGPRTNLDIDKLVDRDEQRAEKLATTINKDGDSVIDEDKFFKLRARFRNERRHLTGETEIPTQDIDGRGQMPVGGQGEDAGGAQKDDAAVQRFKEISMQNRGAPQPGSKDEQEYFQLLQYMQQRGLDPTGGRRRQRQPAMSGDNVPLGSY